MKKLALLLSALLLLPLAALAELNYQVKSANQICFPDFNQMTAYFQNAADWIFVTPENLEEHFDMVLARGGTEEEIRQRYARESFVFEAYSDLLAPNECVRMERFDSALSRDIWNGRHMDLDKQTRFFEELGMGLIMPWYDAYGATKGGWGENTVLYAQYTSIPPASLESGSMQIRLINGSMYVLSFCQADYLPKYSEGSGRNTISASPLGRYDTVTFGATLLPQLPAFSLKSELPTQADVGEVTVKGTIRSGGTIKVTLDGRELPVTLKSYEGEFTTVLPLTEEGDHEVVFTVNHPRNTERVERFAVNVSSTRTALAFTRAPQGYVVAGEQTLAGVSDPGATIVITLDENEPVTVTADEKGAFSWTFELPGENLHRLYVMATAPDYKDTFKVEWYFMTVYDTAMEGLYAFGSKITNTSLKDLVADPLNHVGERVKVEGHIQRIDILPEGLGLYCKQYQDYYDRSEPQYFYVTTYGYLHCIPSELMVLDVYGTVEGEREVDGEMLLEIDLQYGTYTTY